MIKANELRIGNKVQHLTHEGILIVDTVDSIGLEGINDSWTRDGEYLGALLGIPLTEGWLLKLGFRLVKYSGHDSPFQHIKCLGLDANETEEYNVVFIVHQLIYNDPQRKREYIYL